MLLLQLLPNKKEEYERNEDYNQSKTADVIV
jgi:hypothetical protein